MLRLMEAESLVKFVELSDTIVSRCGMCHAREPLWDGMIEAPGGLLLETKNDIAGEIYSLE